MTDGCKDKATLTVVIDSLMFANAKLENFHCHLICLLAKNNREKVNIHPFSFEQIEKPTNQCDVAALQTPI